MVLGRFIYGLGAESSYVVQNSICVEWFQGKYLATAMGITISVPRMGTILAFNVDAALAETESSYKYAFWLGFLLCCFSLSLTLLYGFLDKYAKKDVPSTVDITHAIQWRDFSKLNYQFWTLAIIATTIYTSIFTFLALSSKYIMEKWDLSPQQTGFYVSLIDVISLVLTPVFGLVVDKTGKRGFLLVVGNCIAVIGYLLLGNSSMHPMIGIMLLGFHFALMPAALWPCVPLVVPAVVEGTAFAIISSLQSASLSGSVPLGGYIGDEYGFQALCMFFAGLATFAALLSIAWNMMDKYWGDGFLNDKIISSSSYTKIEES